MTHAFGIDVGRHSAIALCSHTPGHLPVCLGVWPIAGSTEDLWYRRAYAAIHAAERGICAAGGQTACTPCWIEYPCPKVRKGPFAHHASGFGLGRRVGSLETIWRFTFGVVPEPTTPSMAGWWGPLASSLGRLKGKSETGVERIEEASRMVSGAREMLAEVPATGRVDAAEGILIAAAAALSIVGAPHSR